MTRAPLLRAPLWIAILYSATACATDKIATAAPNTAPSRQATLDQSVDNDNNGHVTYAVIGDFPYGPEKRAELPLLIDMINADPAVERVIHLGDIKAGSNSDCSDAYFADIRAQFDTFDDPLVYTPGDNEWTDCHVASKNNGLYTPTERLQKVRSLFFPVAGQTLGGRKKQVLTEADDPANSAY